jgi:CRISPR-associated endoribonuclease Cas6
MRVLLTLLADCGRASLPLNYNHAVASLIYDILSRASVDFASHLHDTGFESGGRRFKLFTFSRLFPARSHVRNGRLILDDPRVDLLVRSPVSEFVETFVAGLFQSETFQIDRTNFRLSQAETIQPPDFCECMGFRAVSPITETVREPGEKQPRFLSTSDNDQLWSEIVGRNLFGNSSRCTEGSPKTLALNGPGTASTLGNTKNVASGHQR